MNGKDVLLLHQDVGASAGAADRDVLVQAEAVAAALERQGHRVRREQCTLDLAALAHALRERPPDLVFNLVESLDGTDALAHLVPALLEARGIPFTGASALALQCTTDKPFAKSLLRRAGFATPDWWEGGGGAPPAAAGAWIVKAAAEDASRGLDDGAVATVRTLPELRAHLERRAARLGCRSFAERYVEGREFNLSLLEDAAGRPRALPPAEIEFVGHAPERPRIVGFEAKWQPGSPAYEGTPRRLSFGAQDAALLEELGTVAAAVWDLFRLRGYARVDFRVDGAGRPWVLEANANPCLSPDAGLAAAAEAAGLTVDDVVAAIVAAALRHAAPLPEAARHREH